MNEQLLQQLALLLSNVQKPVETVETAPVTKRPPVKIVKHKETGLTVNAYENSPEYGYVQVEESSIVQRSRTWIGKQRRTALLKGDVESLKAFVKENVVRDVLPGQIVVKEYLEDKVPEDILREFIGNPDTRVGGYEEAVRPFVKRAGSNEDAVELMSNGQRILRFSFYDPTGEETDEKIIHDNGNDIAEYNKERRAKLAAEMLAEKQKTTKVEDKVEDKTVAPVEPALPVNEPASTKKN